MKFLISVLLFLGWFQGGEMDAENHVTYDKEVSQISDSVRTVLDEHFVSGFTFGAAGDVLIHDHLYEDVETADGYDFISSVTEVSPICRSRILFF